MIKPNPEMSRFLLALIMSITKQKQENRILKQKCRKEVLDKIKMSNALIKLFQEDCRLADEGRESIDENNIFVYTDYVFGPKIN